MPSLRDEILAKAKEHKVSVPTVYSWLHRYLAGRECLNSLLPNTDRCGNPGQRKAKSGRRLGRKSRLAKAGRIETEGYVLKEGDPERLAQGYALVKPGVTVRDAYLLTMGAFWSQSTQGERGHVENNLLPTHERPTQPQFEYWGRELHGDPLRRRMTGIDRWATSTLAVTGSAQDQVHAVGQVAMIDSTSTDVYLTSMMSRLRVLPPMHRTIVKDVRSTMLLGFYLGWEDPSSETSLQAILCAAAEHPAHYGMVVTSRLPDDGDSRTQFFTLVSRSLSMEPDNDVNLSRFLKDYERVGAYLLMPMVLEEGQAQPALLRNLFVLKRTLHVKRAADVGPFDPENLFLGPRGLGLLKP